MPLAVAVAGANVHDKWLVEPTLKSFAVRHPRPKKGGRKQHFCGDKGCDYADVHALALRFGYTLHIKARGDEAREQRSHPRYRARRCVIVHEVPVVLQVPGVAVLKALLLLHPVT